MTKGIPITRKGAWTLSRKKLNTYKGRFGHPGAGEGQGGKMLDGQDSLLETKGNKTRRNSGSFGLQKTSKKNTGLKGPGQQKPGQQSSSGEQRSSTLEDTNVRSVQEWFYRAFKVVSEGAVHHELGQGIPFTNYEAALQD